jgi:hypothetical protein
MKTKSIQSQEHGMGPQGSQRGRFGGLVAAFLVCVATAAGCGSTSQAPATDAAVTMDAAPAIGMIVRGTPQPCTEAHSICVSAKLPASMTTQPTKVQIDLYIDIPPTHPPDGIPLAIESPELTAGETVQLRMTDIGLSGDFHILGLVFMPGGGYQLPVSQVDYFGDATAAYTLGGAAINVPETLDFKFIP